MGGKSKGKSKKATESPSPAQSPQTSRNAASSLSASRAESSSNAQMPACFDGLFGGKRLDVKISAIDDVAARDTSAAAQIWLHPAAMTADDVAAGDMVAVVCSDPHSAQPIPPLQLAQEALQLATPDWTQHPDWPAIAARLPGLYCALATVWPAPKIPKSCCRLSWQLADSLGRPEESTRLYVFTLKAGRQQNLSLSSPQAHGEQVVMQPIPCGQLALTWLEPLDCSVGADGDRSAAVGGEGEGAESGAGGASQRTPIWGVTCAATQAAPGSAAGAAATSLSSPVPCTPPRTPQRPISASSSSPFPTSSPFVASSPSPSPSPSPSTPSNVARRLEPRTPGSVQKVLTPGSAVTPGSAKKAPFISEEEMERARWAAVKTLIGQTVGNTGTNSSSSRSTKLQGIRLVEVFAARWLLGRTLLPGNIVVVPVCGQDCCFVVSHGTVPTAETASAKETAAKTGGEASKQAARAAAALAAEPARPLQVVPQTTVIVSSPPLVSSQDRVAGTAASATTVSAAAAAAAAAANIPLPPFLLTPATTLIGAREREGDSGSCSGEEKEGEKTEKDEDGEEGRGGGAAAVARRVAGDLRGITLGSVGGLEEQKKALKEAVLLPLRHPDLFHRYGMPRALPLEWTTRTSSTGMGCLELFHRSANLHPHHQVQHYAPTRDIIASPFPPFPSPPPPPPPPLPRFSPPLCYRPPGTTRYGIKPPRGILLHGPPGTGKTSLARAVAAEAGAALFVINGPELVSEFFGESEEALNEVFSAAQEAAPSIVSGALWCSAAWGGVVWGSLDAKHLSHCMVAAVLTILDAASSPVFIDELDAIAPARTRDAEDLSHRMVAALLTILDGTSSSGGDGGGGQGEGRGGGRGEGEEGVGGKGRKAVTLGRGVVVIGATNREVEIRELHCKSTGWLTDKGGGGGGGGSHSFPAVHVIASSATHGFVGADISALCSEAAVAALRRIVGEKEKQGGARRGEESRDRGHDCSTNGGGADGADSADSAGDAEGPCGVRLAVCEEDFEVARRRIRPSALREVRVAGEGGEVAVEVPTVRWTDIGGLEGIKQRLKEAVEWPYTRAHEMRAIGATPPRGLLLYGPPGCSKTLLAKAVATEARLNFLAVKGPELLSKWVGESERAVRTLFSRAKAAAPAIVFFDEIDGLAVARSKAGGGASGGVGDRVMTQLLLEMDALTPSTQVTVIAATNRPDLLDRALLRPGRFDRLLFVPPPDLAAREKIFALCLRGTPLHADVDSCQLSCQLAARSEGYTGADITAICREAKLAALELAVDGDELAVGGDELAVGGDELAVDGDELAVDGDELAVDGGELAMDGDELARAGDAY
ncbi:unnamed protein product [Closterium sp. NIES-54]